MIEPGKDEIFLQGRVQVETTIGALAHTGRNSGLQELLKSLLSLHQGFTRGETQQDLRIHRHGGKAATDRIDIVDSLEEVCLDPDANPELRTAASALYGILNNT